MTQTVSRWRRALTGAAVTAITALAATPAAQAAPAPESPAPQVAHPLHARAGADARIVDDQDRTVILHGANVNGLGEYYREWPDLPSTETLTEDDFARLSALGANVVRLIISWSALEPTRGVIDQGYLDRVERAVGWARAHDIYVLLDMHQDAWGPAVNTPDGVYCPPFTQPSVGWDGAPAWATAFVGTSATCRIGMRELSVAVQTSFQNFYLDVNGVQSELVQTWAAVAARFAADPTVVGYDLLNEPNPGLLVGVDDYALLGGYYQRAIAAIRAAENRAPQGFRHIVFFEPSVITGPLPVPGPLPIFTGGSGSAGSSSGSGTGSSSGSGSGSGTGSTGDENMVYAPHEYNESISILPGSLADGFGATATAARDYGTTFFNGEWGFWDQDPAVAADKARRYARLEDDYLVGGTYWQWRQACGDPHAIQTRHTRPNCSGPQNDLADNAIVQPTLSRAYPRAVPGRLTAIHSDIPSGTLTVTGRADRAGQTADLWVPERCANPRVTGSNTAGAGVLAVGGGHRVTATITAAGDYSVQITCG
ncbi:cellulase family glycosylhydrolase [Nocardia seriolae]|uniref:Endoglycosylceramidase n=1 Tax=Nocardia seriolae TaxID=37332 RepID=A0A0B8MZD4_9NOCA|nr:cellulase family glycosylhydrolase [Nocardia seriolae]APA94754.1 Endoglycosylceramidase [Nocardia seriolae]MTJ60049.1 cellulase family glycosylhydrolase [Nocardia seriolae]MTJ70119.1 cellulase family glycosylhydrolase [Nocardia seriolae]MTJ85051.1 cellulase family glycosylhydrolase [Nocardia seriolae]MTK37979.1 cellulase family glycosylhydrolase [Nocardia seriolae]